MEDKTMKFPDLLDRLISGAIEDKKGIASVYNEARQKGFIDGTKTDDDKFFRIWELRSRKQYFIHQIVELDNEMARIYCEK